MLNEENANQENSMDDLSLTLKDLNKQELLGKFLLDLKLDLFPVGYKNRMFSSATNFYLANQLLKVLKCNFLKKNSNYAFEAYSKGIGIFCIKDDGVNMNEYISGYFGEIYPPWLWFEKQDIIKSKKLEDNLPDFYNIMLERHKFDDDGYDVLMVDPSSKGNFASRMSHSCVPNCNTVLMVSEGKYTIGMFATKDIKYGEELTFDYNSVTEKEQEFKDAICLCSSFSCRGNYLIFSKSLIFTEVLNKYHNFLHRNAILLYACFYHDYKCLTEEEVLLLDQFSIKNCILKKAPFWLKKWCAMILKFIDLESKLLPFYLYKAANPEHFISDEKKNIDYVSELVPMLSKNFFINLFFFKLRYLIYIDKELNRDKKNSNSRSKGTNAKDNFYGKSFKSGDSNIENLSNYDFILNLDEKDELNFKNYINNSNNIESNIHETMVSSFNEKKDLNKIKFKKLKKEVSNEPKNFNDNFIYYAKKYESKSRRKNRDLENNQEESKKDSEKSFVEQEDNENSTKAANHQNAYLTNEPDTDVPDIVIHKKPQSLKKEIISEESMQNFGNKGRIII